MEINWTALRLGCHRATHNGHQVQLVKTPAGYAISIDGRNVGFKVGEDSAKEEAAKILSRGNR